METYKSNYIQKNYVEGKVIIITGASSGFGKLTAKRAAEMGGKIVLAARSEEKLKETVAEIKAAGGEASYIVTDVAKKDDVFAMAKFAVDTYGRIDVLVNNAGTMPLAFFSEHEQALDKWEQCIDISIKGTIFGISAVYDQMIKQGQGQVILLHLRQLPRCGRRRVSGRKDGRAVSGGISAQRVSGQNQGHDH